MSLQQLGGIIEGAFSFISKCSNWDVEACQGFFQFLSKGKLTYGGYGELKAYLKKYFFFVKSFKLTGAVKF